MGFAPQNEALGLCTKKKGLLTQAAWRKRTVYADSIRTVCIVTTSSSWRYVTLAHYCSPVKDTAERILRSRDLVAEASPLQYDKENMKIGLSLGGGGARGYAHIGVLRALEEAEISIDLINGASIGAIVGGAYALYGTSERLQRIAADQVANMHLHYSNIFQNAHINNAFLRNWLLHAACNISSLRSSVYSHKRNLKALEFIFGEHLFSDTVLPFSAAAVDIISGKTVSIKEGKLVDGVLPSISIPGIFPPVRRGEFLLVDGGVLSNVPVRELREEGADFVIGVGLGPNDLVRTVENGFSIVTYVDLLKGEALEQAELESADFGFTVQLPGFDILKFDGYESAITKGYETAKRYLPQLERKLNEARSRS